MVNTPLSTRQGKRPKRGWSCPISPTLAVGGRPQRRRRYQPKNHDKKRTRRNRAMSARAEVMRDGFFGLFSWFCVMIFLPARNIPLSFTASRPTPLLQSPPVILRRPRDNPNRCLRVCSTPESHLITLRSYSVFLFQFGEACVFHSTFHCNSRSFSAGAP